MHLIIELLNLVLNKSLMQFNGEFFQQFFGIIIGTNVAPILANLYLAMLQQELETVCKTKNMKSPTFYKRGFGILLQQKQNSLHG